ncbi:hypothetical protein ACFQDG_04195 [Natronoarchaeum mannanilyticum]|uniref:Methyltransferase domain-containing protein n=1 Tax=Natronoarchaeum mannanilyticum TaxID=926360 RepID=A0AAV3TBB8_9EURY
MRDTKPEWKDGTISAVRNTVEPGDLVVEIGSGFGVATIWAARCAGKEGTVTTYEASRSRYDVTKETVMLNGMQERVEVVHALVGENVDVFGELEGARFVDPDELPEADVLITDCEGAETKIIESLDTIDPERAIIEAHGFAGAPSKEIKDKLVEHGYEITAVCDALPGDTPEKDHKTVVAER